MSRTIDERVVSMQFDNKHFESNVQTSLTTLDKLKKALKLDNATKGLHEVGAAAKKCDLAPLGNSAHMVGLKFNALYTVADQAFRNMYNSAERYAKQIVSAFTIDPVKTGFQEYETQLNAVQTILANTQHSGTTLDDVNAALDQLNTYADKTIYNFTQMTRNIGTFTAAGVSLDASVRAIQGIANLAAVSGSNSQQASTAMYQLSQALAAGRVSLMDWNSVVNAGMGGKVFQDALIRTSELLGTGAKEAIETYGTFRESLTQGQWLTTEVLTETLAQLSGAYSEADLIAQGYSESQAKEIAKLAETAVNAATKVKTFTQLMDTLKESAQSGWTQSWEYIVGDFEQAKTMWTAVSDELGGIIGRRADRRNKVLEGAMTSNWDKMIKKINEAGVSTTEFEDKLRTAMEKSSYNVDKLLTKYGSFENIFQSGTVRLGILKETFKSFAKTTESVDISGIKEGLYLGAWGDEVKQLQTVLTKLGYELPKYGIDGLFKYETLDALNAFQKDNGLKITKTVDKETLDALKKATTQANELNLEIDDLVEDVTKLSGRDLLMKAFGNIYKAISIPLKSVGKAWREIFKPITSDQLYSAIQGFEKFTSKLILSHDNAEKLRKTFKGLFAILDVVTSFVGGGIKLAFKGLNAILEHFDLNILDVTASIGDALVRFRDWVFENNILAKGFDKFAAGVAKGIVIVRDWIKAFWALPEVQAKIQQFKNAFSGAFDGIKKHFKGTGERFKEFIERVKQMDSLSIGAIFKDFKENVFDYFVKIDYGKIIEKVKEKFKNFVEAIKSFFSKIGTSVEGGKDKIMSFFNTIKKFLGDNMGTILAFGSLIVFIRTLHKIKDAVELLAKPFDILDDFLDGLRRSIKKVARAIYIKNLATSIFMIAGAVAILATLPQGKVWSSVGAIAAIGAVLAILSIVMAKVDTKDMAKMSTSLISLGAAILMMAAAAKILGGMTGKDLAKGGIAVAGFLGLIIGLAAVAKHIQSDVSSFGRMMVKLSASLLILALAIKIFGKMDSSDLIKGSAVVLGFLGVMTVMMEYTSGTGANAAKFGTMMLSISAGLILMSYAIKILGKMDTKELIQGGLAVTIFMGVMTLMMKGSKGGSLWSGEFGKMMAGVGVSLLLMAGAIKILGSMEIGDLVKGGIVIALLMGLMGSMMILSKDMGKKSAFMSKFGVMMMGFGAALLMVTGSILLLSMVNEDDLKRATVVIGAIGLLFMGLLKVTKNSTSAVSVGTIIGLSVAIGVLAAAVAALSFIPEEDLYRATGAMTVLVGALSLLMLSIKKLDTGWKSLIGIGGMILLVAGVAALIVGLTHTIKDPDGALKSALAISSIILALSGAAKLLAEASKAYGPRGTGSWASLGWLATMIGGIAGIGILLAEYTIRRLPFVAEQLSLFMEKLGGFISDAKDLKPESFEGIKTLVETMSALAGASFKFSLTNLVFGGSAYEAINAFKSFIEAVVPVVKQLAIDISSDDVKIDIDKVNSVVSIVKTLAEAAALAPSVNVGLAGGGWKGGGFGAIGVSIPILKQFTQFVKDVLPEVKSLATDISGLGSKFKAENLTAVVEAVVTLANAAASAPTINGTAAGAKMGAFVAIDIPMLGEFGRFVTSASTAMSTFAKDIEGVDVDGEAVTSICEGVSILATAASDFPSIFGGFGFGKVKGFWGVLGGIELPMLWEFKTFVENASEAMKGFTDNIQAAGITADNVGVITDVCNGVKILAQAANEVPGVGVGFGLAIKKGAFAFGTTFTFPLLREFKLFVENASESMKGFMDNIQAAGITEKDGTTIKNVCDGIRILSEAANNVPGIPVMFGVAKGAWGVGVGLGFVIPRLDSFKEFIVKASESIASFMDNIKEAKIDEDDADLIASICESIEILSTAAGNVPGVKVMLGFAKAGPIVGGGAGFVFPMMDKFKSFMETVSDKMVAFMTGIKEAEITEKDASILTTICNSVKTLAEAAGEVPGVKIIAGFAMAGPVFALGTQVVIPQLGKFKEFISGSTQAILDFTTGLKTAEVSDDDVGKVTTLCDSIEKLAKAAKDIPSSINTFGLSLFGAGLKMEAADFDGFNEWLNGTEDKKGMGDVMSELVDKIKATDITPVDTGKLNTICGATKTLAEAAKNVPTKTDYESIFKDVIETADFEGFTKWVTDVAAAIGAVEVGDLDVGKLQKMADVAKTLSEAIKAYVDSYTYNSGLTFKDSSSNFLLDIQTIADSVKSFNGKISEINPDSVYKAASAFESLATALVSLDGFEVDTADIQSFANLLSGDTSLVSALKLFVNGLEGVDVSGASAQLTAIMSLLETASTISYGSMDELETELNGLADSIAEAVGKFDVKQSGNILLAQAQIDSLSKMVSGLSGMNFTGAQSFADAMGKLAETSISNIVTAFEGGGGTVATSISGMLKASSSSADVTASVSAFSNVGFNISAGIATGISSGTSMVTSAAKSVIQKARAAADQEAEINSPSKLFMRLGYSIDEGLALGIDRMSGMVERSSKDVVHNAFTGTQNALSRIASAIDSDIDIQPTIRPVVDLTDVRSGAHSINGIFGMRPSIRTMANLDSINSGMRSRQNGSNDDVVSAINSLGKSLGNMSGDTYNVNGITYDDGSNIVDAVKTIARFAKVERRR